VIRIGIVGLGHWGPNLVRCFSEINDCKVTAVCDQSYDQLIRIKDRFPSVYPIEDYDALLARDIVDAIVIATPTSTHFDLAAKALAKGIHVFVEKPLANTSEQCRALIALSKKHGCTLFVGHIFLHAPAVQALKNIVDSGELGKINYMSSRRLNLGPVRSDVSALYDLAPHDIAMMMYLMNEQPDRVSCTGMDVLKPRIHDVCNLSMNFGSRGMGMIHVSWLDPRKERILTVVGDKKMAIYDDLEQEKIKIHDQGIESPSMTGDFAEFQIAYRYGGSYSPFIKDREPLKSECADFVRCVRDKLPPLTGGENGLAVVEVLEAAHQSLMNNGQPVRLDSMLPVRRKSNTKTKSKSIR
jgi:predicted dehydrogenase